MDDEKEEEIVEGHPWGYVVCFGMIITFVSAIGHINSFGLIYNDFMIETHSSAKALTSAHGVFAIMLAVGGMILNSSIRKVPMRVGGIIGAIIFSIGSLTTVFISNLNQLPITFGVLQGIGFGVMVPVTYSTFNQYFIRKRTTVMSFAKALQGIIATVYPQLVKTLVILFGFRGTLLIISGIALHTIPGMMIMMTPKRNGRQKRDTAITDKENTESNQENVELINCEDKVENGKVINKVQEIVKKKSLRCKLLEIVNLKILKDPVYCNICIGQSFVNFSDITFFMLQSMLLFQYKYDQMQVAACISIGAGADVAGRFFLALISSFITINTRILFYIATLVTFILRLAVLQVQSFLWMAILTGMLGVLRAWLHIASPLVISHQVSHKDFPGAYAALLLCCGVVNVSLGPIIGVIKDLCADYVPAFYTLTACCLPCLLFWPVEYTIIRRKNTRTNN